MVVIFDQFQRYKHIEEILNLIRCKNEEFTILEVGANQHKNLESFLPKDSIKYLDIEVPEHLLSDPQYIQADATNMPEILDNSFDFVVAVDVFEHIPKTLRELFIIELHRVAKNGVILGAPFDSVEVESSEIRASEYYRQFYGTKFRWLDEHRENGLPNLNETMSIYKSNDLQSFHFEHGTIEIWEKMLYLHFLFANPEKVEFQAYRFLIDDYYNKFIYEIDYGVSNYRTFIVSCSDSNKLRVIQNWIETRIAKSKLDSSKMVHLEWLENQLKTIYSVNKTDEIITTQQEILNKFNENKILEIHLKEIKQEILKENFDYKSQLEKLKIENHEYRHQLHLKESELEKLRIENHEYKHQLQLKENHIINIEKLNEAMRGTRGWRGLEKLRKTKNLLKRNRHNLVPKVIQKVRKEGLKSTINTIESKLQNELGGTSYNEWYYKNKLSIEELSVLKEKVELFEKQPLISVVVPTYNTPLNLLDEAIQSLKNQIYPNWELCICDDQSPKEEVWERLQYHAKLDNRVKIIRSSENLHIAGATNLAISLAKGEYVGFLDHDDILTEDALYEVVKVINETNADLIYSDEDKLEMDGTYSDPFFKPDWSPDYLLSTNYICHFAVYKKSIGDGLGWINKGYDGAQDYDFVLRYTEQTKKIEHISKVLYHWRKIPGSTAESFGSKSYAQIAGENAVTAALKRRNIDGIVEGNVIPGHYIVKRNVKEEPRVSIIIPTKDKIDLLSVCISSVLKKTTYSNYEIIVINNRSEEQETFDYFEGMKGKIQVLDFDEAFNYSKMNNFAVENSTGEFLLFLNNDTEVIEPNWLTSMVEHGLRNDVGVVGAKLLYTNNTVQHAGVILGVGGVANHAFLNLSKESHGYFGMLRDIRNCSAVTAACMLVRRDVFNEVNGFNEVDLKVAFNDVDLCLKIRDKGYLCVWTPLALLYHHESATRTRDVDLTEVDYMLNNWAHELKNDPYYNKKFDRNEVVNSYSIYK